MNHDSIVETCRENASCEEEQSMSKFNLMSADSHVVEPAGLWTDCIDPAFRDRAPFVQRDDRGVGYFYCDGVALLPPGGMSLAGLPDDEVTKPRTVEDIYPGAYDPDARLKEMAVDGVEAEVLYPSIRQN